MVAFQAEKLGAEGPRLLRPPGLSCPTSAPALPMRSWAEAHVATSFCEGRDLLRDSISLETAFLPFWLVS